jgi:hypothetical protein
VDKFPPKARRSFGDAAQAAAASPFCADGLQVKSRAIINHLKKHGRRGEV